MLNFLRKQMQPYIKLILCVLVLQIGQTLLSVYLRTIFVKGECYLLLKIV